MNKINKLIFVFFAGLVLAACSSEDDLIQERIDQNAIATTSPSAGSADFSKYVSVGNSLTAGFMDGALYNLGQANSFPNLLAGRFALVGGGAFNQPDINSENGFNLSFSNVGAGVIAGRTVLDVTIPGPVPTDGELITPYSGDKAALNNFGVPGARVIDLATPALIANPYYNRFASNPGTSTVLGDAIAANGTFFTFWIGSNDVLGWALSGGTGPLGTDPTNPQNITDPTMFSTAYQGAINALTASVSDGVVLNIPPILTIPFFQAVQWNAIPFGSGDALIIAQLNGAAASFNGALDGLVAIGQLTAAEANARKITHTYAVGQNPVLIADETLNDLGDEFDALQGAGAITAAQRAALVPLEQARLATPGDFLLLTAANQLGTTVGGNPQAVVGVSFPLSDEYVLIPSEQVTIETHRAQFNASISSAVAAANANGADIALIDVTPTFADLAGLDGSELGIVINGVTYAPDFTPNGIYSTDGVHANPRGYAIIANVIIEKINEHFGASLPLYDIATFPSVQLLVE